MAMPAASRREPVPVPDRRPPAGPWHAIGDSSPGQTFVSFYISDDVARWPVRAITLPRNNKSDPNLETLTYGLFSTCEPKMRAGIVRRNVDHIVFLTNIRGTGRHITGFYELGWYAHGTLWPKVRDFALAANRARFVDPIPISDLQGELGERLRRRWRTYVLLDAEASSQLLAIISAAPDRTPEYLAEIDRLERINLYRSGYRYVSWKRAEPWGWGDAAAYLPSTDDEQALASPNTSPSGRWRCEACGETTINQALLKLCPHCRRRGTLQPIGSSETEEGEVG